MTISLLPSIDYTCDPISLFPPAEAPSEVRVRAPLAKTRSRRTSSSRTQAQREQEEREQRQREAFQTKELIEEYTPLVRQIVGGFQRRLPRNVLRDDLMAAGMAGLWDAIRRHQTERTVSFEWYVRIRIRGAILDELRAQDWLPRRARAAAENAEKASRMSCPPSVVRLDDVNEWEQNRCLATGEGSNSEASVEAKFQRETLERAVAQLPERERHIVASHYFRGVKFKDLGAELGVSEPRISQLHSRAMQRLRALMENAA